jgi:hypothetical protein
MGAFRNLKIDPIAFGCCLALGGMIIERFQVKYCNTQHLIFDVQIVRYYLTK